MTATAERLFEEIRHLPPADLRGVCEAVNQLVARMPLPAAPPAAVSPLRAADDTLDDEAAFFAALEEARQLWGRPGREVPELG